MDVYDALYCLNKTRIAVKALGAVLSLHECAGAARAYHTVRDFHKELEDEVTPVVMLSEAYQSWCGKGFRRTCLEEVMQGLAEGHFESRPE